MTFEYLHFIRPYWLLALIPLALLLWLLFRFRHKKNVWTQVCDRHLLPYLLVGEHTASQWLPFVLLGMAMFLSVIALSGPSWSHLPQKVYRSLAARVIVLDLNKNMYATDINPNRLVRAKYKIHDILKMPWDGQTGMVVFSGEAYVVSPLTQDAATISAMINELSPGIMPTNGNNIYAGLKTAAELLEQGNAANGDILLISDSPANKHDIQLAKTLHNKGMQISVLGIGTNKGAPIRIPGHGFIYDKKGNVHLAKLDSVSLKQLAKAGGGNYIGFTQSDKDINQLISASLDRHLNLKAETFEAQTNIWNDEGHWFILFAIPFAAMVFRRGWLKAAIK